MPCKHTSNWVLVLVTVDLGKDTKDALVAAKAIGVPVWAIDQEFGVVMVNPAIHRHAAGVDMSGYELAHAQEPVANRIISAETR